MYAIIVEKFDRILTSHLTCQNFVYYENVSRYVVQVQPSFVNTALVTVLQNHPIIIFQYLMVPYSIPTLPFSFRKVSKVL